MKEDLVWSPQPGPQHALVDCPVAEVFFGGARGGGKTDGVLGKWALKALRYGAAFNAIMFRRTTVSAEDAIERSKEIYGPIGGKFNDQRGRWRLPGGGRVSFRYLEGVDDANEYQGRNVTDAWVEEAGQYPSSVPIDRLFGVLRSAHGVPVQLILTANPGGAGQRWLRERYRLFPFPAGPRFYSRTLPDGAVHHYAVIPSRLENNAILLNRDPGYISRLQLVGSAKLVKAWREGDWSAIEGAFFECWDEAQHVVEPFDVPTDWLRFRSGDWGSASPFSFGWWTVAGDDYTLTNDARLRVIPRGALVRYREWYGAKGPNVGLKLTAEQAAAGIISRERGDPKLSYGVLDPANFSNQPHQWGGGPSIAERINTELAKDKLIGFHGADNQRVARSAGDAGKGGPMGGWDAMRSRLIGSAPVNDEGVVNWAKGRPMIYCFSTCTDSVNQIPILQHDSVRIEDVDTDAEDHIADEWRYACMSRPWVKKTPGTGGPKPDAYREPSDDRGHDSMVTL